MKTMVITDLDDTLLTTEKELSEENIKTLKDLRNRGIIITIATGRPLYFIHKVKGLEDLADYFITSTGLGVWNCSDRKLIYSRCFCEKQTETITSYLQTNKISFMLHKTLPENHMCHLYRFGPSNDDLDKREKNFRDFILPLTNKGIATGEASVFMLPGIKDSDLANKLKQDLEGTSIELLTSPYNRDRFWIEILPENVNKGTAVQWLSEHLNVPENRRIVIGNDHNDKAMLILSEKSYVVANASDELKEQFIATEADCNENGFTEAVRHAGLL